MTMRYNLALVVIRLADAIAKVSEGLTRWAYKTVAGSGTPQEHFEFLKARLTRMGVDVKVVTLADVMTQPLAGEKN